MGCVLDRAAAGGIDGCRMDLKEATLLGDAADGHWYYRAKLATLLKLVADKPANRILDVGAGSGFFARQLLLHTDCRSATCVDPGYLADTDETISGKPIRFRRATSSAIADLVLLMDVLEHVEDDAALLSSYVAPAAPGTRFVITVPAFNWLWSEHDVFLEHYRRYTLAGIEAVCAAAGLEVTTGCYFYGTVLPLAVLQRLLVAPASKAPARSQMRTHSPLVNNLLWLACRMELPWCQSNRIAGLTAFVAARKP